MVFFWIRDSVLQCFCKSCKAATIADQKPNIIIHGMIDKKRMPSKRVIFATEIRASEEKKGGLKYELVLADPAENPPPKVENSSPPKTPISVEDIQNKLKAAEERRISMETQKLNQLSEKLSRLQEVSQKKQESINNFMEEAKKCHELKMESNKENKDAIVQAIKNKLQEHDKHCSEIRNKSIENEKSSILQNINTKLNRASEYKDSQINALQERLKLHDQHITKVRQTFEEQMINLKLKHESKLNAAISKRENILGDITERMKQRDRHVETVRQNKQSGNENATTEMNSSG